ncbi:MAG TPA: hypothetical protein ACFYD0_14215 [Candidatus Wunengus sp. YC65]|uniref:hypothetical protein n=1 Tax=Candidatus Wunengus sp. YC65 TaxID=3367701 RepID=UPI00402A5BB3
MSHKDINFDNDNSIVSLSEIEKVFDDAKLCGVVFDGWSLTKNQLCSFAFNVMSGFSAPHIIELGSGSSTLFWLLFNSMLNNLLKVSSFEHHPTWINQLKKVVSKSRDIEIHFCNLRQVSDAVFGAIFNNPGRAFECWRSVGSVVPLSEVENTRIRNAFYDIPSSVNFPSDSIAGIVVDGPHGNGRSLAFPLFYECLKSNAFILIDDLESFPYLDDLGKLFRFKVINKELPKNDNLAGKNWALLKLEGKLSGK